MISFQSALQDDRNAGIPHAQLRQLLSFILKRVEAKHSDSHIYVTLNGIATVQLSY
jgi:hypothetical protein